jgi:hypothetical protein
MPASSVGQEIKQLQSSGPSKGPQKGRRMPHKQAVAVALNMARRGSFGRAAKRRVGRRG